MPKTLPTNNFAASPNRCERFSGIIFWPYHSVRGQCSDVCQLAPTKTTPPLHGFLSLDLHFEAVDGERIYGLGQHKTGKLDNKGGGRSSFVLNPHNTEILIPVAHSSEGYAFLFNLPSFGRVEYNDTDSSAEPSAKLMTAARRSHAVAVRIQAWALWSIGCTPCTKRPPSAMSMSVQSSLA